MKTFFSCKMCGKQFFAYGARIKVAKCCSKKCLGKYNGEKNRKRFKTYCSTCGKELNLVFSRKKGYSKYYCSRKCQHKGLLNGKWKNCSICGKKFYIENSRYSSAKFCSLECNNKNIFFIKNELGRFVKNHIGFSKGEKRVEYVFFGCLRCGKKFEKIKHSNRKFCSKKCHYQSRIGKPGYIPTLEERIRKGQSIKKFWLEHPDRHPSRWIDGRSYRKYGKWFKPLREKIRKRDGGKCMVCLALQNGERLSVHHIDYEKKNYEEKNLTSTCRSCHAKTNVDRDYWINYFQKKMEELYGFSY